MKTDPDSNELALTINRHYNKKELCFLFGNITRYYLDRMIDDTPDIGKPLGSGFSPRQILMLIIRYGLQNTFAKNQTKFH